MYAVIFWLSVLIAIGWEPVVHGENVSGEYVVQAAVFFMFASWVYSFAAKKKMYFSAIIVEYSDKDESLNRVLRIIGCIVGLLGMGWYLSRKLL